MAARRVAIVGAGLAGLAAALELRERGWAVEMFERSRLLGGRATSFEIDGLEVDNGQAWRQSDGQGVSAARRRSRRAVSVGHARRWVDADRACRGAAADAIEV